MIGQTLSHYRIVEQIGQGGMGVVYKAQDLHLDRLVAVKMLPSDKVADPERRRRFIQEAKSASALNHPNIITIHDIDEADGNYFIAMEYVQGKTLHELIRSGELQLVQSLDYAIQIGDALTKAHSAGIIHRDIKPSNVMVTGDNIAKVLDFGLAKLTGLPEGLSAEGDEAITLSLKSITEEGKILGTLSYMSPEQARGREVDRRTDIFSLGVILYQMITGQLPFRGPHAAAVLDKLLYSPTPSLKNTVSNLPDTLELIVNRATAKAPGDRYQHMQEMVSDLRFIGSTGEVVPPSPKKKRRRSLILVFVAIVLTLLLALQFRDRLPRWPGGTSLPDQIILAVLPFNNVSGDEESQKICDGLMMMLVNKLTQIESFRKSLSIISSNEVSDRNITTPARAREILAANMTLECGLLTLPDRTVLTINLVETDTLRQIDAQTCSGSAGDLIALGNEAVQKVFGMLKLKLNPREQQVLSAGATSNQSAHKSYVIALHYMARYDVIENIDKAIRYFQQATQEDPQYALAYAGLGEAYWVKYERSREHKWIDLALSNCRKADELETLMADVHKTMGIIYTGTGQQEKALDELKLAIEIEPGNARVYQEMGNAYQSMNRFEEAEAAYSNSIELKPDSWSGYFSLGVFYYNRARYEEAVKQFQQVLQLAPDHSVNFSALGAMHAHEGDFEGAEQMFFASLAVRKSPEAYSNLASIYILQRRSPEAVPLLEEAKDMEGATYVIWGNLGQAYSLTPGSSVKAQAAFKRAAELVEKDLEVNPKNISANANLAYYLIRLGNKKQALEIVSRISDSARENPNVLFKSALVYEWAGDREKALNTLSAAAAKGYSRAIIQAAPDLDQLRNDPRYHDVFEGQGMR